MQSCATKKKKEEDLSFEDIFSSFFFYFSHKLSIFFINSHSHSLNPCFKVSLYCKKFQEEAREY